ncbi:MAG: PDGLE domain-containing protein [Candidatus Nanopelagicus sp.]
MKVSNRKFFAGAILISALLAGGVSFYASSSPDGLEKVAEDVGFIETAKDHTLSDFTLADYGVSGLENARLSVGLAGLIGVVATAVFAVGFFTLIRKKAPSKNQ